MFRLLLIVCLVFAIAEEHHAKNTEVWVYPCKTIRVVDGDTSEVEIDLGFSITVTKMLRVLGVDAPEKNTEAGQAVKASVAKWVEAEKPLKVKFVKEDKFGGRFDGDLIGTSGERLSQYLLRSNQARPYNGEKKTPWDLRAIETYGGSWVVYDEQGREIGGGMSEQDALADAKRQILKNSH